MSPETTIETEFNVADKSESITVRKLLTPRGQLVEIESTDDTQELSNRIRIDALGLESLSWQSRIDLARRFDCDLPPELDTEATSNYRTESFEINNEYADTVVIKATTSDSEAVIIRAPVKKTELLLSPEMLNKLSLCETDLFSEFLETPHGPHDH